MWVLHSRHTSRQRGASIVLACLAGAAIVLARVRGEFIDIANDFRPNSAGQFRLFS